MTLSRFELDDACLKYAEEYRRNNPDDHFGYALLKAMRVPVFQSLTGHRPISFKESLKDELYLLREVGRGLLRRDSFPQFEDEDFYVVTLTGQHQIKPLLKAVNTLSAQTGLKSCWLYKRSLESLIPDNVLGKTCIENRFSGYQKNKRTIELIQLLRNLGQELEAEFEPLQVIRWVHSAQNLNFHARMSMCHEEVYDSAKFLLTANPRTFENAFLSECFRSVTYGMRPIFSIQHGHLVPGDPTWRDLPVDQFWVFGEEGKAVMKEAGYDDKQVKVVGSMSGQPKIDLSQLPNLKKETLDILVAFSGPGHNVSHEQHREVIDVLSETIRNTDHNWTIRLHPKDDASFYEHCASSQNVTVDMFTPERLDFGQALKNADVVVTVASNAANEALMVGRPVINILPAAFDEPQSAKMRATFAVRDSQSMIAAVKNIQELDASYRSRAESYLEYTKGGGGFEENISAAVAKLIET